jgi:transcriptional regulator with XRE-family HTH domain
MLPDLTKMKSPKSVTPADEKIGELVRLRRKEVKLSQEKLGKLIGVTFQQIQKYERGTNRIGAVRLTQIAAALQVPVGYFIKGAGGMGEDGTDPEGLLSQPGAVDLLRAYAQIPNPALRRSVLELALSLAKEVQAA